MFDYNLRNQYLSALGIEQWCLRDNSERAAETKATAPAEKSLEARTESLAADQPSAKTNATGLETGQNSVGASMQKDRAASDLVPPRFAIAAVNAGPHCLFFCDLAAPEEASLSRECRMLLDAIIGSLGSGADRSAPPRIFRWPILKQPHLDQSEDVARESVKAFYNSQLDEQPCTHMVLMGEASGLYLSQSAVSNLGVNVIHAPALHQLLRTPLLKRQVWESLQPVRARLVPRA